MVFFYLFAIVLLLLLALPILILQIISCMVVLRSLVICSVYFKHRTTNTNKLINTTKLPLLYKVRNVTFVIVKILIFILALITYVVLTLCSISELVWPEEVPFLICYIGSPLLLSICLLYFKQRITYMQIVFSLFSSLPLAALIIGILMNIHPSNAFSDFIILVSLLLVICIMRFYARTKDSVSKNIAAIFILVALSTSSIIINATFIASLFSGV